MEFNHAQDVNIFPLIMFFSPARKQTWWIKLVEYRIRKASLIYGNKNRRTVREQRFINSFKLHSKVNNCSGEIYIYIYMYIFVEPEISRISFSQLCFSTVCEQFRESMCRMGGVCELKTTYVANFSSGLAGASRLSDWFGGNWTNKSGAGWGVGLKKKHQWLPLRRHRRALGRDNVR